MREWGREESMGARGGRKRLSGATAGGWCKGLDADKVRRLRGRLGQYFAGRRAHMWFAAICARWGVTCTAQDGGRRAIFQATAARRQIQPRRAIFQATAHRWPSTSCDDKLRSDHGAPFFMRQRIADRRHHATTICGKLVTERPMRWPLPVCADPARKCRGLDAASTSHEQVGLCAMQCLLCNACQACDGDVVLLNALLCVHGAHA